MGGVRMFGDRLKEIRKRNNLTQEELATILGVSRSSVAKYEANERYPEIDLIVKAADYFCISVDYLLDRNPSHAERIAVTIAAELNKRELLNDVDIDNKIDSILNVTEVLIIEFAKHGK
jgi:transcriptional regulator with XRE-family HTH domain